MTVITATACPDLEVMQLLIERGTAVDVKNDSGITALSYAARMDCVQAIELLLEAGAGVHMADCKLPTTTNIQPLHRLLTVTTKASQRIL